MSNLSSLKEEIIKLLNENKSEKTEVNKIVENFNKINHNLTLLYKELDKLQIEKPIEENEEVKNFSLIDQNFLDYIEVYIPKSLRYEINYSLMEFFNVLFNIKYFIILNNTNSTEQESIMINFCNNSLKIINNFRGSPFFNKKSTFIFKFSFPKEKESKNSINRITKWF